MRPALRYVARPPRLPAETISSSVCVWNSAAVTRPAPVRHLTPASRLVLTAGRRPKFSPGAWSGRYDSSLSVGVSKPRPYEAYRLRFSLAA
ncbi:Uncharacterised protein [Bordetella pertussis]|nr:Uncharacterised protein [Bordetella pertussis]CFW06971.1 Uncharacterised protein [Bordetella pertussis]